MLQNAVEAGYQLRMNAPVDSMRPGLPLFGGASQVHFAGRFAQRNHFRTSDVVGGCGSEWTAMQRTCQPI